MVVPTRAGNVAAMRLFDISFRGNVSFQLAPRRV
jgi:hypothetical protein